MVYFTLNFILGMAFVGLILLLKSSNLKFKVISVFTGLISLCFLVVSYYI
jgi:hypothetical protein